MQRVWLGEVRVQSNFARRYAAHIAMAASLQMITTQTERGVFVGEWHVTTKGLKWLKETED